MAWGSDAVRDLAIRTLIGESDGSPEGMSSVAHVMKNRADSGAWGAHGLTRTITAPSQFSIWNPGYPHAAALRAIPTTDARYQRAAAIADGVFSGQIPDPTGGATHYHTPSVSPDWSQGVRPVATIGGHYFYKLPLTASNTAGTAVTGPSSVGVGTSAPVSSGASSAAPAREVVNAALTNARSMLGKNEVPNHDELMQYLHDGGQDLDPHKLAWCAAFVSASLQKAGLPVPTQVVKDSAFGGGALAGNFKTYGSAVDPNGIQAGDILVANDGSHVGFAEGPARQGPNGPEVQMLAGNEKDTSGQYAPGSYTNPKTGAVANRAQVGMVGERWVPVSQYTVRRYQPADSTTAPAANAASTPNPDAPAPQAQPVAAVAPPGSPPTPGSGQNPSAGFVGPGSDKYTLVKGMTTGTGRNPQLTMAADWGNLFGGGAPVASPATASAAPAPAQPTPDLAQRVPLNQTPTPPPRPADATPSTPPPASILPAWGADTPNDPARVYNLNPTHMPGAGLSGMPMATPDAPSMGFPAMTNPFAALPGSMFASAQNLIKLLYPTG